MGAHDPPITQVTQEQSQNSSLNKTSFDVSNIDQLDGNATLLSNSESLDLSHKPFPRNKLRERRATVANYLPVVTVCNARSLFPKIENFKNDLLEQEIDVSLVCEVWEKAEDPIHKNKITEMLEFDGLKYFSTARPKGKRGGGVAIIVNQEKFTAEKINVQIPRKVEAIWVLLKPKSHELAFVKKIILCAFYSPPGSKLQDVLKDHIIGTL